MSKIAGKIPNPKAKSDWQREGKAKARLFFRTGLCEKNPGNDLLSRTVTSIVPSALRGLSALFGMGRGISPAALSPEKIRRVDEQLSE